MADRQIAKPRFSTGELLARINELEERVEEQDRELDASIEQCSQAEAEVFEMVEKGKHQEHLHVLDLVVKESINDQLRKELEQQAAAIDELNAFIARQESAIKDLRKTVQRKNRQISELTTELSNIDRVEFNKDKLKAREKELDHREKELEKVTRRMESIDVHDKGYKSGATGTKRARCENSRAAFWKGLKDIQRG